MVAKEGDLQGPLRVWGAATSILGILMLGVFVLPYVFPGNPSLFSASTLARFNNSLAFAWYVLCLGPVAYLFSKVWPKTSNGLRSPELSAGSMVPPAIVTGVVGLHVALFTAVYVYKHGFVSAEALYFQDQLYRMLLGEVPFRDVHFFYGPAMLYPAEYLAHFVRLELAYGTYFILTYILGLYVLYVLLASFLSSRAAAVFWFTVLSVGLFNPYAGMNYAWIRHLLPMSGLLATWHSLRHATPVRLMSALTTLVLALCYSPEVGVVTLLSVSALVAGHLLLGHRAGGVSHRCALANGAVPVLALAMFLAIFYAIDPSFKALRAYLDPILTFSAGGWNTPIDPSLPMICMIGLTVFVGAMILRLIRERGLIADVAWYASYALMAVLMQRAAFGKADVLHIAYSGLPVYLMATQCVQEVADGRAVRKIVFGIFILGLVLPLQIFNVMQYAPFLAKQFSQTAGEITIPGTMQAMSSKAVIQNSITKAVERFGRDRLYYMHKLEYYRLPVYRHFRLRPFPYYPSLTSAFTPADIKAVIAALQVGDAIVIARKADLLTQVPPTDSRSHWLYGLLSCPLPGSIVHKLTLDFQAELEKPLVEFLSSSYEIQFEDGEIFGLAPKKL